MTTLLVSNPATGQIIDRIPTDDSASLREKYRKAKSAQGLWSKTLIKDRVALVVRFKNLLLSQIDLLAKDLTLETGKPITQSRSEIKATATRIDFFVERSPIILTAQRVSSDALDVEELVEQEPLGVIANISAWNYPYFVGLNVIIPALLAKNAVIYKPSEFSTLTGLHIVRLLKEAGFPNDLIFSAIGNGSIGEALLDLPLSGVFFTGSYATGQRILQKVASRMIPVQLELGGKDGVYVCEDANLDYAVPSIADGAFYNTGQSCCSVERLFIHEAIYDRFKEKLIAEVRNFKVGDPMNDSNFIGPITRAQHREFLHEQIREAQRQDAKVILGGESMDGPGSFFAPTILECLNTNSRAMQDETFGPIVCIQKVSNDEEAIGCLNDTPYGLTAGIYTKNRDRAVDLLNEMQTGSVYWNCCDRVSPRLPWTGRKSSGMGATLGDDGIRCFTKPKAWHLKIQPDSKGE